MGISRRLRKGPFVLSLRHVLPPEIEETVKLLSPAERGLARSIRRESAKTPPSVAGRFDLLRQFCAFSGDRIVGTAYYAHSPDGSATLGKVRFARRYRCLENEASLISFAAEELLRKGCLLIMGLAESTKEATRLQKANFLRFGTLLLMELKSKNCKRLELRNHGLSWERYSFRNHPEFARLLQEICAEGHDFPRLPRRADPEMTLSAHMSVGVFDPRLWFLAKEGPKAVGLLLLSRRTDGKLWLTYLGVIPEKRRLGIGRVLLERATHIASAEECSALVLGVDSENEAAIRLYKRAGFKRVAKWDGYFRISMK